MGSGTFKQSGLGDTEFAGEWFGYSLAAGHIIGDAADDLAVGCPFDNDLASGGTIAGKVFVIEGDDPFGLSTSGGTDFNGNDLSIGLAPQGRFGWSLAIGRMAHQATLGAVRDLAIGEPGYPTDGQDNSGRVVVTLATQADPAIVIDQEDINGTSETVEQDDEFGWALATGRPTGGTFDDLAVGTPMEARGITRAGAVAIFRGTCCGFPAPGGTALDGDQLFAYNGRLELGYALAYGYFDSTSNENLAVGAPATFRDIWVDNPGGHLQAGQVHIYAPHRQVLQTRARSAAVFDCDDNLIFSIHPFDKLQVASTTKAWPAWIAADRITWTPADSELVVTVDPWTAFCFNGSEAGLQANEEVELIDLMRMAVSVSGGDACHAIADGITGQTWNYPSENNCDPANQIPYQTLGFTDSMNFRATQIGMDRTIAVDPAGRPYSKNDIEPQSTAWDMSRLARRAMQNQIFRDIVGTEVWEIERTLMLGNVEVDTKDTFTNQWLKDMRAFFPSDFPWVNGVKPGSNTPSKQTRVLSAVGDAINDKDVVVTLMGVQIAGSSSGSWANTKTAQLCSLAVATCGPVVVDMLPLPPDTDPMSKIPGIPTTPDTAYGAVAELDEKDEDVLVEIYRQDQSTPTTSLQLCITKKTDWILAAGEARTLSVTPKDSTSGVAVRSLGYTSMDLQISHNQPLGTSFTLNLPSGGDSLVVPASNMAGTDLMLTVENLSTTEPETLQVEEICHYFDVTLGDGTALPTSFSVSLHTDSPDDYRSFAARILGKDPSPGNTVILLVRRPGTVIAVDDPPVPSTGGPGLIRFARIHPNPSRDVATIEYALSGRADVRIEIFDLAGRLVRRLENAKAKGPGIYRLQWNQTTDSGSRVSSGVYFYRVAAGSEAKRGRLVVLN
jgi:D-alanyl-D-alanine carboxypeptidase